MAMEAGVPAALLLGGVLLYAALRLSRREGPDAGLPWAQHKAHVSKLEEELAGLKASAAAAAKLTLAAASSAVGGGADDAAADLRCEHCRAPFQGAVRPAPSPSRT